MCITNEHNWQKETHFIVKSNIYLQKSYNKSNCLDEIPEYQAVLKHDTDRIDFCNSIQRVLLVIVGSA